MTNLYYTSTKGNIYSVEFMNNINGIQFYKISRTGNITSDLYRKIWLSNSDKIIVKVPKKKNKLFCQRSIH